VEKGDTRGCSYQLRAHRRKGILVPRPPFVTQSVVQYPFDR